MKTKGSFYGVFFETLFGLSFSVAGDRQIITFIDPSSSAGAITHLLTLGIVNVDAIMLRIWWSVLTYVVL